jgi:hypothetical protein
VETEDAGDGGQNGGTLDGNQHLLPVHVEIATTIITTTRLLELVNAVELVGRRQSGGDKKF